MVVVYTKDNCPQCDAMKHRLKSNGTPFSEINVGKDISRDDFVAKFPHVRMMPHVVIDKPTN